MALCSVAAALAGEHPLVFDDHVHGVNVLLRDNKRRNSMHEKEDEARATRRAVKRRRGVPSTGQSDSQTCASSRRGTFRCAPR